MQIGSILHSASLKKTWNKERRMMCSDSPERSISTRTLVRQQFCLKRKSGRWIDPRNIRQRIEWVDKQQQQKVGGVEGVLLSIQDRMLCHQTNNNKNIYSHLVLHLTSSAALTRKDMKKETGLGGQEESDDWMGFRRWRCWEFADLAVAKIQIYHMFIALLSSSLSL